MIDYDPTKEALFSPEKRPTLFVAGADLPLPQLAIEAARLAYLRAEDAPAERARLHEALARVGFGEPELFPDLESDTGSYGFGCHREADGVTLLAFRGTQSDDPRDLIADTRFAIQPWPETGGRVHSGFAQAARSLLPAVQSWLGRRGAGGGGATVVIAGHSLGAAIATLAAAVLRPALLVTLGSPRVGDAEFAQALADTDGVRLVDCADIVTRVPPAALGYRHVRPPTYITSAGNVVEAPSAASIELDCLPAQAAYLERYALQPGNVGLRALADHAPINYLRAFFA